MAKACVTDTDDIAEGKLPENIVYFARALRDAGLKLGPASVVDAVDALRAVGIGSRDDLYWTLHCILVAKREDHATFDEAFRLFWRSRDLVEKMIAMFSPMSDPRTEPEKARAAQSRVAEALFGQEEREEAPAKPELEIDASFSMSANEVLRTKDFAQMSSAEFSAARAAIAQLSLPDDKIRTRRFRSDASGNRVDMRSVMRKAMATGGDLLLPQFKSPREVQPPLVVLADISGSMSQYSRIFLHFLHALSGKRGRVHTFLFGTRLTNITRALRSKDPDQAMDDVAAQVLDWEGGTRIGATLHQFNRQWSRRVLGQGASVLLITDGLERASDDHALAELSVEMERLQKSCRRLIWLNPLLRFDGFEPRAAGVRTMLPFVDDFRTVHSLDSLTQLCDALDGRKPQRNLRMTG
ncbi:VWA domain-containing protein [Ahrensia sp. R2A130]|uniref:vWA domain-containing protein n=1 Tax=Ahrensia sp. R2A130 TaxID=744979 RepID=UPI0001E0BC49|nr:VWA domain-containing protein [Ahrensia sp. R2A130]EFL90763.1 VWA containing CoxE family protein [Ahrensia sp. R2A130]